MTNLLDRIVEQKKEEVHEAKRKHPLSSIEMKPQAPRRDFAAALHVDRTINALENKPKIIAEIKKASPSKGLIRADFNVADIARSYTQHGAACLSVLTDVHFFQGHPSYIATAKSNSSLPVLRKDFIIDEYQIIESLYLDADCILLIAAILDAHQMHDFTQMAHALGLHVLVESHTSEELQQALDLPTPLMGINNRNLQNFITDIHCSIELGKQIPNDKIIISESGINSKEDIQLLQKHGINAFLIGESLMRADHIGKALTALFPN